MKNDNSNIKSESAKLVAWLDFSRENDNPRFQDCFRNSYSMKSSGNISNGFEYITMDGDTAHLSTINTFLDTSQSFSVAAWVRLDSRSVKGSPILKEDEWARTAVSQSCETHSMFYLGIRRTKKDGVDGPELGIVKWSFTIAPEDGEESGPLDWCRTNSSITVDEKFLDKWVLIVGTLDTDMRVTTLYIPSCNEVATKNIVDKWQFWSAKGPFNIGKARWLNKDIDYWPGSVGLVRVYSGALTKKEVDDIYKEDNKKLNLSNSS